MRCGQGAVRVQSVRLSASPYGLPVFSGHFAPRGARQERRAAAAGCGVRGRARALRHSLR